MCLLMGLSIFPKITEKGWLFLRLGREEMDRMWRRGRLCTVNKLGSKNLLFSCMFHIERKIVHVGTEKIITLHTVY
jgi:hypothetical protein